MYSKVQPASASQKPSNKLARLFCSQKGGHLNVLCLALLVAFCCCVQQREEEKEQKFTALLCYQKESLCLGY